MYLPKHNNKHLLIPFIPLVSGFSTISLTMAIFPLLRGVEVSICVNDVPLVEHEDDAQPAQAGDYRASRTMTKYLEVVAGTRFGILSSVGPQYNPDCPTLGFQIYVEGVRFPTQLCMKSELKASPEWVHNLKGDHEQDLNGADFLKPFTFSAIGVCKHTSFAPNATRRA